MELMMMIMFVAAIPVAFFTIAFLQSGWDKIADYRGNLDWFNSHFKGTVFGVSPALSLVLLTIMECVSGLAGLVLGLALLLFGFQIGFNIPCITILTQIWIFSNGFTLISLFLGQRIAKDYAGAVSIVNYGLMYLFGALFLFAALMFPGLNLRLC